MYYIATGHPDQRLKRALVVALLLHCALILGVSFEASSDSQYRSQIDVTLAYQPAAAAPDQATHFAQVNQAGSGDESEQADISTQPSSAMAMPVTSQQQRTRRHQRQSTQLGERHLTTSAESERLAVREQAESLLQDTSLLGISPEVDQLAEKLANLEATLDEQSHAYSNMPRVRRLTSLSTRAATDAAYLNDWRQRVEAVGNQYYPEASVRYSIYGSLRLLVVIHYNGQLEDIRVLSSSGYAMLDEAAIKIVRMAAPYAPFPPELRATADRVEIIRTWQFQENRLSSG